jgi:hypothetical protein
MAMDLDDGMEQAALFAATNHLVMNVIEAFDRMPGENGVAVFAALVMEIVAEDGNHACERGQSGGHINPIGSLHAPVDLLQRDEIWVFTEYDLGDALEINLTVHAASMMDVVGQHTQGGRGGGRCSA